MSFQSFSLSPLLSNIMLHELGYFLELKKEKYVRYADDFSIYAKGKGRAQQIGNQVFLFLKNKLKLTINKEKSGIRRPTQFQILGHGFVSSYEKGAKGKFQLVVSDKSMDKLKRALKVITRKTSPMCYDERIRKLKLLQRGWLNYFCLQTG